MWASLREKIVSGSSTAYMVLGQSFRATKLNFTQEWKFYTNSMKEVSFSGKDFSIMQIVRSQVSLGSTFCSKPISRINSLMKALHNPCDRARSFSSISGGPGMAKTDNLDQPIEDEKKVPMSRSMWKVPFVDVS